MIQEKSKFREVRKFYDEYSGRQVKAGINARHHSILKLLKEQGFKKKMDVLEIGCGVGTLTELLIKYLKKGYLTSIDISPQSIEIAKTRLSKYKNLDLIAEDITEWETNKNFDAVVLPDVLEHIPKEKHQSIFLKINSVLKEDGFVFIHIPDPVYLDWIRENQPDKLQIIDQSLFLSHFEKIAKGCGFYITYLNSYTIWQSPAEYQAIVLRKVEFIKNITSLDKTPSLLQKLIYKIKKTWVSLKH